MRILLAVDGSPGSKAAVEEICRRPWPVNSDVRIITVLCSLEPSQNKIFDYPVNTASDHLFRQQNDDPHAILNTAVGKFLHLVSDLNVTYALLMGQPKDVILDEAERWGADLIVVGSHGYGTIRRFSLGSVSLAVVLHATCSVEIVRRSPNVPAEKTTAVS